MEIDGGGTKTEFAVVSSNGHVVKQFAKGGCNPNDIGYSNMATLLIDGIEEVLGQFPTVKSAFCGVANAADIPIFTDTGAEVLTGSTRLKAGTVH